MVKYVVLARNKKDDCIMCSFGCFESKRNAIKCMNYVMSKDDFNDVYYCIEDVDPYGSYANEEPDDECYEQKGDYI